MGEPSHHRQSRIEKLLLSLITKQSAMKNFLIILLLAITASANAQVNKMIGYWNTFDDKTGDMASCVQITENNGTYSCVVINLYEKDANGKYTVMNPPYPKAYENIVGSQLFIDMEVKKDLLKGKVYDPESQKTYFGKVTYKAKTDELELRGSLDKAGLLGRSQVWKRKQ